MKHKYYTYILSILCLLLLVTGCKSKHQEKITLPADFKGPKELSRLYGVNITPNDNIFLYNEGAHWLGTPHRMGGSTKRGVDCSGFVGIVYNNCKKGSRGNLKEGDLVFFRTGKSRRKVPTHVGIYLKNGKFIHTSTSGGVMVSSLSEPYYMRTWLTGGRVK